MIISSKKIVASLLVIAVLATGGYLLFVRNDAAPVAQKPAIKIESNDKINYRKPTDDEKQSANTGKQQVLARDDAGKQSQAGTSRKAVKPIITYADQYSSQVEVGSIVQGLSEDGGICTAQFSSGTTQFTKSATGVANANSTSCPAIVATNQEFATKGTWTVVVSYASSAASGSSDPKAFEVK